MAEVLKVSKINSLGYKFLLFSYFTPDDGNEKIWARYWHWEDVLCYAFYRVPLLCSDEGE